MKWTWVVLVMLFIGGAVSAQDAASARATYAGKGVLIGLADLTPLRDCTIKSMQGKVKKVKSEGGLVRFDLYEKKQRMTFRFAINRLGSAEQMNFRKDFLHEGLVLRASGYACSPGQFDPLEAISIDRVY
jgi:hypothetical protein